MTDKCIIEKATIILIIITHLQYSVAAAKDSNWLLTLYTYLEKVFHEWAIGNVMLFYSRVDSANPKLNMKNKCKLINKLKKIEPNYFFMGFFSIGFE